ncbi:MAG: hypothetical protein ACT4P4_24875 [Betaproteobacteria bacterium]
MTWDRIQGDWQRFKVNAKARWNKLSEQQLADWQASLAAAPSSPERAQ